MNLQAVADAINDVDPDQEVDQNAIRSDYVDQAEWLADNTSVSNFTYVATGTYDEISAEPYLSRYPDVPELYEDTIGTDGYRCPHPLHHHQHRGFRL